jgi:hypothetical protein
MFGFDSFTALNKPRDLEKIFLGKDWIKWQAFRESEDSRFAVLTMPRVLARLPYGAATRPIDEFEFEECDLDENGKLKPEIRDIVHLCADRNVALFFGHATHAEIYQLAEEVEKVGLKRAVIDHPYSPFLNVSPEMMKKLSPAGIFFNFTWDELSPLLGVDPQIMYNTIREVGVEHFTLSSDAGEPLFPDSVEAMRLVRGYMEAFGLNQEELYTVCTKNPAKVVGLEAS